MTKPSNILAEKTAKAAELKSALPKFLTKDQVESLVKVATSSRNSLRNEALIKVLYTHGLRANEALNLTWDSIDLVNNTIRIDRLKGSKSGIHSLSPIEVKLFKKLKATSNSMFVFVSEQQTQMSDRNLRDLFRRWGQLARIDNCHSHMLRHAKGYALANAGVNTRDIQEYLGHKDIKNTVIYTDIAPNRLKALVEI